MAKKPTVEKMGIDPNALTGLAVTQKALAELMGLNVRTIRRYSRAGLPRNRNGRYSLGPAVAWIRAHEEEKARAQLEALDVKQERAALLRVQRQIAEYELEQTKGRMLTVDAAGRELDRILDLLRARLLQLPGKYPPQLVNLKSHGEARRALEEITRDVLAGLTATADEIEAPSENGAPAGNGTGQSRGKRQPKRKRKTG